jgi:hypothetical protein
MNNKVLITADQMGSVIGVSKVNPEYGFIRVTQLRTVISENGWLRPMKLSAFIRGKVEDLQDMNFVAGQELNGKLIIKESTEPFNKITPDKNIKVAGETGIVCCYYGAPIYREVSYTTNVELEDILVPHNNTEEIKVEMAKIRSAGQSMTKIINSHTLSTQLLEAEVVL